MALALELRAQGLSFVAIGKRLPEDRGQSASTATRLLERALRLKYPDPTEQSAKARELGLLRSRADVKRDLKIRLGTSAPGEMVPSSEVAPLGWTLGRLP